MSKYNVKTEPVVKATTTHQGGSGYTQRPEAELIGILSTGIQSTYYEKETEREVRLKQLINTLAKSNKQFVAKALVYARSVFGQRTVTHLGAVNLLPHLSGDPLGKRFFTKRNRKENKGGIIYRIDDMTEILACYIAKNNIKIEDKWTMPKAMKVGFKIAIEDADTYELAKYQMKSNSISLVDIVNLVHPVPSKRNGTIKVSLDEFKKAIAGTKFEKEYDFSQLTADENIMEIPALRALVIGLLKQFNTVEDKNTEAGKEVAELVKSGEVTKAEAEKILVEKKAENFEELIRTKKIGYLALLRNLRNIIKTSNPELLDLACTLVVDKEFIRKSLVWPHQIDLALEVMLLEFSGRELQKVAKALEVAYENSIPNLEHLLPEGKTAVVFDTSGSMEGARVNMNGGSKPQQINSSPAQKAALIAATFAKGTAGDVYHFGTTCARIKGFNPNDSINTLKKNFESHNGECGHGTYYSSILPQLEKEGGAYERIIIITDEQGADSFESSLKSYSGKYGTPYVYFINIVGYGPTMAKAGNKVFRLFGYSADIYEKIPQLEISINEVIDAINRIEL
jgi:60 kDa SS-A/Ro ribonucleoprotein